jgi:serine/threonine protein kinase
MDYREGVDLSRWAELELPPPGRRRTLRATASLDRISAIIAEAHALDVIHHDLKPQNILVAGGRTAETLYRRLRDGASRRRRDDGR